IEHGANIHAGDDYALQRYAYKSDLEMVKYLVEHGAYICVNDYYILTMSAKKGYQQIVKYVIERNVHITINNIGNALFNSVRYCHLPIIKCLIQYATANFYNDYRFRVNTVKKYIKLIDASISKYDDDKNNANLHNYNRNYNNIILQYSAENGDMKIVNYLYDRGIDIHFKRDYALRYSSKNGHLNMVKFLVNECHAYVSAYYEGALRFSIAEGHLDIIKFLVEEGANIH